MPLLLSYRKICQGPPWPLGLHMISCSMSHRTELLLPLPSSVQTTRLPNREPQAGKGTETFVNYQMQKLDEWSVHFTKIAGKWQYLSPIEATVCRNSDVHTVRFRRIAAIFGREKPHCSSRVVDVNPWLATLNAISGSKPSQGIIIMITAII